MNPTQRAVAARAASLLLRYPDTEVQAALPTLRAALDELPAGVAAPLRHVATHRATLDPVRLAGEYVDLFDFRRRCCLHLTYYTHGDTRRRGEALVHFSAAYRAAGLSVADGELPDYLPAVLDLAATTTDPGTAPAATTDPGTAPAAGAVPAGADPDAGWRLLREHRVGLDLLHAALAAEDCVYRHAVAAVRTMLPAAGPADLAAATRLARTGPPAEQVGLEPYGFVGTTGGRR